MLSGGPRWSAAPAGLTGPSPRVPVPAKTDATAAELPLGTRLGARRAALVLALAWLVVTVAGALPLPGGLVTGELTRIGWSTALAAIAVPAYAWTLHDAALRLGGITIGGAQAMTASVALGLLWLAVMPALVWATAAVDHALIRGLLR